MNPRGDAPLPPAPHDIPSGYVLEPGQGTWHPDRVRGLLAFSILGILTGFCTFLGVQTVRGYIDTREFAEIVLPIFTGFAGAIMGFYFASQVRD